MLTLTRIDAETKHQTEIQYKQHGHLVYTIEDGVATKVITVNDFNKEKQKNETLKKLLALNIYPFTEHSVQKYKNSKANKITAETLFAIISSLTLVVSLLYSCNKPVGPLSVFSVFMLFVSFFAIVAASSTSLEWVLTPFVSSNLTLEPVPIWCANTIHSVLTNNLGDLYIDKLVKTRTLHTLDPFLVLKDCKDNLFYLEVWNETYDKKYI